MSRPGGLVLEEYEFFRDQGYLFEDIAVMLGLKRDSLAQNLRRNGVFLVPRNGSFYETGKRDWPVVLYPQPADMLAAFLALGPPQGFKAAEVARQLRIENVKHFLETLRRAGAILTPMGGRGSNAGPLAGHYRWEINGR